MGVDDGVDGECGWGVDQAVSPRHALAVRSWHTDYVYRTNWPVITLKHDDVAKSIIARRTRDECAPNLVYTLADNRKSITSVTVGAANANCGTSIPVTVPSAITTASGATKEQVGKDPLTLWVSLGGNKKTYTLDKAIAF